METLQQCDADNASAYVKGTIKYIKFKKSIFTVDKNIYIVQCSYVLTAPTFW